MAICTYCECDMNLVNSCSRKYEEINGKKYRRLVDPTDGVRCHDCGILNKEGNAHHPGCDMEKCPVCKTQAMCCDCDKGALS